MQHSELFQQMATISRASAYDISQIQIAELKQSLRDMILLHDTSERKLTPEWETKVKRAKILSI